MTLIEVHCAGCGVQLLAEAYSGPPRRQFDPGTAECQQWRQGWRDGLCPRCRPPKG